MSTPAKCEKKLSQEVCWSMWDAELERSNIEPEDPNFENWLFGLRCAAHFGLVVKCTVRRTATKISNCSCRCSNDEHEDESHVVYPASFSVTQDDRDQILARNITAENACDVVRGILCENKKLHDFPRDRRWGVPKASPYDLCMWLHETDHPEDYRNEKIVIEDIVVRKIPPGSDLMKWTTLLREFEK